MSVVFTIMEDQHLVSSGTGNSSRLSLPGPAPSGSKELPSSLLSAQTGPKTKGRDAAGPVRALSVHKGQHSSLASDVALRPRPSLKDPGGGPVSLLLLF